MTSHVTILVCGDPARGDDGAAIAGVRWLAPVGRRGVRVRRVGQLEPDDLVEALADGTCVVVDAVRGIEPGRVVERPLGDLARRDGPVPASSHALPIETVVGLTEALGAEIGRATFVGIGGERFDLGAGLSERVEDGLPALAETIGRHLGGES